MPHTDCFSLFIEAHVSQFTETLMQPRQKFMGIQCHPVIAASVVLF